jgi:uncharacterized protein (TIGR02444 family)
MRKAGEALDDEALWRFSLAFYALPGVAGALIALQDRDGLDVNLMLFALWLGVSGQGRLTSDGLAAAERAIGTVRTEIIEPLRTLRRRLRHHCDEDVRHLREGVKALELAGEKAAQARLVALARGLCGELSPGASLAAACGNLSLYLGPKRAGGREAAQLREALEAFAGGH